MAEECRTPSAGAARRAAVARARRVVRARKSTPIQRWSSLKSPRGTSNQAQLGASTGPMPALVVARSNVGPARPIARESRSGDRPPSATLLQPPPPLPCLGLLFFPRCLSFPSLPRNHLKQPRMQHLSWSACVFLSLLTRARAHARTHTRTHARERARARTHTHAYALTHVHVHTHASTHARARTHPQDRLPIPHPLRLPGRAKA